MHDDDRELVRRCLAHDQSAMIEFVQRFRDAVFRLCFRMLAQRQDAEDAAQETFVRALRSLSRWDSQRPVLPWLLAIAGNRCRTALAARRRRPVASGLAEEECPDRSHELQAARNLAEEVQAALDLLRPEYRGAFVLFHEQELSCDEIARVLGRPAGTIKTWIRRARQELIARLRRRDVLQESRSAMRGI